MYHRRRGNGAALTETNKMKNFFCVGQKVIVLETRKIATVETLSENGLGLDNGQLFFLDEVQPLEEYQDPTNYFYHHSRFATGQEMANNGFRDLMFVLEERDALAEFEKENNKSVPRFHDFLNNREKEAADKIQCGLVIQRTAEYNLNQWGSGRYGKVMAQHMPFLNPEDCKDYIK